MPAKSIGHNYGLEVRYTMRAFTKAFTRLVTPLEVTPAEFALMRPLANGHLYTQSELADLAALDRPYVTSLVRKLIERGLLETRDNPTDRRRLDLRLSKKGQAIYKQIASELDAINLAAVKGIPKAQLETFLATLKAIRTNLEEPE